MSKKYKLKSLLFDIKSKIQQCKQYQKSSPDQLAQARVKLLDDNPCNDGKYYVNITLQNGKSKTIEDKQILKRDHSKNIQFDINENKMDFVSLIDKINFLQEACIIEYNLQKNEVKVTKCESNNLYDVCKSLLNKTSDSAIIKQFNPSSASFFSFSSKYTSLSQDYQLYKNTRIKTIYYSIGRFKSASFLTQPECNLSGILNSYVSSDQIIDSFTYSKYFQKVSYVNMSQKTSVQKNINEDVGGDDGSKILNSITCYDKKQPGKKLNFEVFDIGHFFLFCVDKIQQNDYVLIPDVLKEHKRGSDAARLELYKQFTGDNSFKTYGQLKQTYEQYKKILKNKELYQTYRNKDDVKKVIVGCKNVDLIFRKNVGYQADCIKTYYLKSDLPSGTFQDFKEMKLDYLKAQQNKLITDVFQDYVHYVITANSNCDYNKETIKGNSIYEFVIPVQKTDKIPSNIIETTFYYQTDKQKEMCLINVKIPVNNKNKDKKRSDYNSNKVAFHYYDSIELSGNYVNVLTGKKIESSSKQKNIFSTYNIGTGAESPSKLFFSESQLFKYQVYSMLDFSILKYPKQVQASVKSWTLQKKGWNIKAPALTKLNECKKEYQKNGDKILRLYIDTINYDPWERLITQLNELYTKYNGIKTDKNGYITVGQMEEDLAAAKSAICSKCGKAGSQCTCQKDSLNLCDKIYPLDLFGLTSKLGIDKSLFGCFSATASVMNAAETETVTCNDFGTWLECATSFSTDKLSGLSYESLKWTYISAPDNDEYKKNCILNVKAILNQIDQSDYKSFIKSYVEAKKSIENAQKSNQQMSDQQKDLAIKLDNSPASVENYKSVKQENYKKRQENNSAIANAKQQLNKQLVKTIPVGIINGYAYVPIGRDITFIYSSQDPGFIKIDGTSPDQSKEYYAKAKTLAGQSYMSYIKGKIDKDEISDDAKKFLLYPYLLDVQTTLGGQSKQNQQLGKYQFRYYYIPQSQTIMDLTNFIASPAVGQTQVSLTFDIYLKQPIQCGYPKDSNKQCSNAKTQECKNGKCGLQDLFSSPIKLCSTKFDAKKQFMDVKAKTISMSITQLWDQCLDNLNDVLQTLTDPSKLLEKALSVKDTALNMLYQFGKNMMPMLNLFPLKCLTNAANDGRNAICSASRKVKQQSSIDQLSFSIEHTYDVAKIVVNEAAAGISDRLTNIAQQLGKPLDAIGQSLAQLYKSFTIYQLCPRRFNDYLSDSGFPKSFTQGLNTAMSTNISNTLKQILGTCVVDGVIDSILGDVDGLLDTQKSYIKKVIQQGDSQSIAKIGSTFPQLGDALGHNSAGLSMQGLLNRDFINTDFLDSFYNQISKKLDPSSLVKNTLDSYTKQQNIISLIKTGAKSLITGGPTGMTSTLIKQFKRIGVTELQNELQTTLSNWTSGEKSKYVKSTVITNTQKFIKQKEQFYSTIKNPKLKE